MASSISSRKWRLIVGTVLIVLVAGLVAGGYWLWRPSPCPRPDMTAVMHANNRGIGHMEQFKYDLAQSDFEEAVRLAPDCWMPGRINLGIALLNQKDPPFLARAIQAFDEVLKQEPDNPYAHYCLGVIAEYQGHLTKAVPEFEAVTRIDPNDAHAWMHLGACVGQLNFNDPSARAAGYLRTALRLNPNLNEARYRLAQDPNTSDAEKTTLLADKETLARAVWEDPSELIYSTMGRYADVIGRSADPSLKPAVGPLPLFRPSDSFHVTLAPGAHWAKADELGDGAVGDLRREARRRFGATMVLLDYNHDGKLDIFLVGAVVEKGKVRDLLLRNDGDGRFTDITTEAGLAGERTSLGCAVADYDNDGFPDLLITGAGAQKLFRNTGDGRFEDVTAKAGLDKVTTVCLGAGWADLDQDGDLDLILCQYADTPELALNTMRGGKAESAPGLAVFLNVGEAPPNPAGHLDGLTTAFRRAGGPEALLVKGPTTGVALSDVDGDRDLDLLALADGAAPAVVLNDRLLRFHWANGSVAGAQAWNGALVLDADHDERSDLFLVPAGKSPILLLSGGRATGDDAAHWFHEGATNSPPLRQAQAIDVDLDGWTDVVGLSQDGKPVLLHNDGTGRLVLTPHAFGPDEGWPADVVAVAAVPLTEPCHCDLLVWSETNGLQMRQSKGNGNNGLDLELTGLRERSGGDSKSSHTLRTNADGIGVWAIAQAGTLWTGAENTTLSAGLGQSRLPLTLGIGPADQADVLRLRWPDGMVQAELNVLTCDPQRIKETDRKGTSCPVLFTWNGQRFTYVTDFLGAGSMGELGADGRTRTPRPEESVKIEADQLIPRDGQYVLKIAEPMDEILYLDHLQLVVLDHPKDVSVYPDERFAEEPPPSQDLLAFRTKVFPVQARDHRGRDITETLRERDGKTVDGFDARSWIGFAEDHWVELDFGDRLAKVGPHDRLFLCLAGWTDYPYPESIYAAQQAGVPMRPPVMERLGADGQWKPVGGDFGFPAGLPRVMTKDVTGLLGGSSCRIRLRTNLQIYWDQIYAAPLLETAKEGTKGEVRVTLLEVTDATLAARGILRQTAPAGGPLVEFDADRTESVAVTRWTGALTKLGPVTELLRRADDCFVVCGPGDEITVRFDAGRLPPLPDGWTRSFVLKTRGYCKDSSLFTETGGAVGPQPFRAMSRYPYGAEEHPPAEAEASWRRWNTRRLGPDASRR